ncbi:ABC transporter permease [Sphingomicrobium sediminis]|uniref:ABC transporter permease n=1 Tax=Sphingomicrobium sediminis TaxID=2950949 RepID=A0A9X2EG49_9SPHN|nr:ABC transporter permease [Sphingomicrobium sediminis]MCM8557383.1 ABC transporter permease [Sphingomicrobium sediminis]
MNNILLIAAREYRHIAKMRSFWITMLLLPALLLVGPLIADFLDDDRADRIVLIDRDPGNVGEAISERIAFEEDVRVMNSLARYVRRHDLQDAVGDAPWAEDGRAFGPADVLAFRDAGGLDGAIETIDAARAEETPAFEPSPPWYEIVETPAAIADASVEEIEAQRESLFEGRGEDAPPAPDVIVLVDADYGEQLVLHVWADNPPRQSLMNILQGVTQGELRGRMLGAEGIAPERIAAIESATPSISISTPPPGGGASDVTIIRSILPVALAYVLMMSLVLSGNWLVQGAVEERSNKLIESMLACVRPQQLMLGKLMGTAAIGFSMVLVWVACAIFVAFTQQGAVAEFIRPALEPLANVGAVVTILYFFLMGYVALSTIFLGIGVLSDDMNEANGFVMPVMMVILLPVTFLMQAVIAGSASGVVSAMTWVPPLTPFVVLARLGAGIGTVELIGAGLVLAAFTALMLFLLGRLFQASLLAQGQKRGLGHILARFKAPAK